VCIVSKTLGNIPTVQIHLVIVTYPTIGQGHKQHLELMHPGPQNNTLNSHEIFNHEQQLEPTQMTFQVYPLPLSGNISTNRGFGEVGINMKT
jgi:hypothetical protein